MTQQLIDDILGVTIGTKLNGNKNTISITNT